LSSQHEEYFEYLRGRSRLGLFYRTKLLYPRISRRLKGRVLDVGCGIGDMLRYRPNTVGVDVNASTVAFCRSQGLEAEPMQPDVLPFADASFDGAVLDNVLEHLHRPEPLLAQIHRVLRASGMFVVGVPGRRGYASDPDHKVFYSAPALTKCVEAAGFKCQELIYMPFKWQYLDARLRIYAVYGVFRRVP
jgi:SAM-dependent methyltransferase